MKHFFFIFVLALLLTGAAPVALANESPYISYLRAKGGDDNEIYPGRTVGISGQNLASDHGIDGTYVYIDNQQVTITQFGDELLYVNVPSSITSGIHEVWIQNNKGSSNTIRATVPVFGPTVTYVQSPAEDKNLLHPGERAVLYGKGLTSDYMAVLLRTSGSYASNYGQLYNVWGNAEGADFTVPDLPDGTYDLFLRDMAGTGSYDSNEIRVKVVRDGQSWSDTDKTSWTEVSSPTLPTYSTGGQVTETERIKKLAELQLLLTQLLQQLMLILQQERAR